MSLHAPPSGRITDDSQWGTTEADGANGAFSIASPEPGWMLRILCSDGLLESELGGWEHVSIHAYQKQRMRTPTWKEMSFIKALCWDPDDCVVQFHPPQRDYVNLHPHVLHLWRPLRVELPLPPTVLV